MMQGPWASYMLPVRVEGCSKMGRVPGVARSSEVGLELENRYITYGWQHIKIWATHRAIVALALFRLGEYTMQGLAWAIEVIVQRVMLCEAGKAESKHQSQICCFQERERPVCSTYLIPKLGKGR